MHRICRSVHHENNMKLLPFLLLLLQFLERSLSLYNKTFPQGFLLGVATSAYQVDGAWNEDGKGESIWDYATHNRKYLVVDQTSGDIACDSYHKYLEDIELIKYLNVDFFRFSLSWPRILPNGLSNKVNQAGIDYYNKYVDALLSYNITPMVTLYHWELPQYLQKLGGWTNPVIVQHFREFSKIAFENFGDKVKIWTTINEPRLVCQHGYGEMLMAPAMNQQGLGEYLCSRNLLKAHAAVYHLYNDSFREKQNGTIGIVLESFFAIAASDDPKDIAAQDQQMQFEVGLYAHPIFHPDGDYPQVVKDRIANRSKLEGFSRSRLPPLTREEVKYIRGTSDYFGINHYTSVLISHIEEPEIGNPSYAKDKGTYEYQDSSWNGTNASWLKIVPHGFRILLKWIKDNYGNPPVFVTENGFTNTGGTEDYDRIHYFQEYLNAMLEAIYEDGVNVIGYAAWSLLDGFEWFSGYTFKFGLFDVDYSSQNRTRTPKLSAQFYKSVVATRRLADIDNYW